MTTSGKARAAYWAVVGVLAVCVALPIAIANGTSWAWAATAVGAALVGLVGVALARGWPIFNSRWDVHDRDGR